VVANHAMLELPLHYAYLLLPVGLVIGVVEVRLGARAVFQLGRPALAVVWLAAAVMLGAIVHDYLRVETAHRSLRFEWANIKTAPLDPPDVLVLTQWVDFFRLVRFEPRPDMSAQELQWLQDVATANAYPGLYQKLGVALALNGRPEEAALWMRRMCHVRPLDLCEAVQQMWKVQAQLSASIAAVPWLR